MLMATAMNSKRLKPHESVFRLALKRQGSQPSQAFCVDRKREELAKAFKANTLATLQLIHELPQQLQEAIFEDGLWLKPTTEK